VIRHYTILNETAVAAYSQLNRVEGATAFISRESQRQLAIGMLHPGFDLFGNRAKIADAGVELSMSEVQFLQESKLDLVRRTHSTKKS